MRRFSFITFGQILDNLVFANGEYKEVKPGLSRQEVEDQGLNRQRVLKSGRKYEKIGAPGPLPTFTLTTLLRREVDLGFAEPDRSPGEWRIYDAQKAQAFMIAILERYHKPLSPGLEESMNDPKVKEYLNVARQRAFILKEKKETQRLADQQQSTTP